MRPGLARARLRLKLPRFALRIRGITGRFSAGFAIALAWSCGCGKSGTGSPDCFCPRTSSSRPCDPARGQRPSLASGFRSGRIPGRTVPRAAEPAAGHPSRPADCTTHANRLTRAGRLVSAYAPGTIRPGSDVRTRDVGRVGAASWPRAITSGQTKSPHRQPSLSGLVIGTGYWSTGHDRYRQTSLFYIGGNTPGYSLRWFAASPSAWSLSCTLGTKHVRPLRLQYQIYAHLSMLFGLFL